VLPHNQRVIPSRWGRGKTVARVALLVVIAAALILGVRGFAGPRSQPARSLAPGARQVVVRTTANAAPLQPIARLHTLSIDGSDRTYHSFVPPGVPGRWPLIVVLHGRGQTWRTVVDQTDFLGLARRRQAVLVFPDGVGRSWNAGGGCCGLAARQKLPDVAFVASVLADALRRLPVDPTRVYLVGYSNGGKLAYSLNCTHPKMFAALATYGSAPLAACPAGTAPTPFLIAAGQWDTVLPYAGAAKAHPPTPSIRTALTWLRAQDGCTGVPTTVTTGHVVQQDWTRCKGGSEVQSAMYTDVGHTWPSTPKGGSPSVSNLMWQFLITHRLPGVSMPVRDAATSNP
jgi:polyhydroxybutyrate depolymerase